MKIESVGPALFFGEDSEIAEVAIRFHALLAGLIEGHEVVQNSETSLHCRSGVNLTGYYRPEVRWPVAVYAESELAAVVWGVTDCWPFLAKNFNIIIAEAIGAAVDLQGAFQEGLLGKARPLACFYICIEDCPEARLMGPGPAYAEIGDEGIVGLTYLDTYKAFCRRLIAGGLYDAACFATYARSTRTDEARRCSYPAPEFSFTALVSKINEHASVVNRCQP